MDEQTFEFTYDGEMLQALFDKANALPSDPYVKPGLGIPDSDLAEEYAKKTIIGDLNDLETDVKDNLVDAINEAAQTGGGATLTGYVSVASIADLPDPGQDTIGYLVGENLYLYVGTGGDTLGGKYQDCGPFRGPSGPRGENAVGFENVSTQQDGTIVITLTDGNTITIDLNHNHPAYYSKVAETNNPSGGFLPDVVYSLGTLTGSVTFALAAAVTGNVNHYFFMFSTGGTAPTITWPTGITWAVGSAPTVAANKKYEISILDGVAYYSEV